MIDSDDGDALDFNPVLLSIDDFTKRFLKSLLQKYWGTNSCLREIQNLSIERVQQGVLSHVFRVRARYKYGDDDSGKTVDLPIPNQWIVKLPRKDVDLDWMFRSERIFYEVLAPVLRMADLPFTVPRILFGSDTCLILEGIEDVTCHSLMSGTPADKVDFVTFALASLHAQSFKSTFMLSETKDLVSAPGIGHRLHPLQKEYLFTQQWRKAVEAIQLEDAPVRDFIVNLCEAMESRRLRDVHDMVHKERYACVHGDYHIANFLFPDDESKKPTLIDWATWGWGNPMTDLAFFLVLNETVSTDVKKWLHEYYENLTSCNPDLRICFSFETMLDDFRLAILYQWIILVAYNKMNRQLAVDHENPGQILKHFENVNRRAVIVMHGVGNVELVVERIPLVTEQEKKQAQEYSIEMPLSI